MARYLDDSRNDSANKTRRQQEDQRRMAYRRAIEDFDEQRRLQLELADYPELVAANYLNLHPQAAALGHAALKRTSGCSFSRS